MDILSLLSDYEVARRSGGFSDHTIERVALTVKMAARDMNIKKLEDFTTDVLLEWGQKKRDGFFGKPLSQSGLYAAYNSIRSFLIYLENRDIEHFANRKMLHCKPSYKERKCLTAEDVRKIVPYARYDIGLLMRLLFTAGMRISEALPLTVDDLRHDNTIILDHSKWCESRTVLIRPEIRQEMIWAAKDSGYIFHDSRDSAKPMDRKVAYYHIKYAMKRAGYGDYYPHAERHGFATELLRNGADLTHVRRMMGHKNITTTQIYEHLVIDDLRKTHSQFLPVV